MKYSLLTFLLVAGSVISLSSTALGQSFQNLGGQTSNTVIRVTPPQPKPNESVTVSIENYGLDLDRSDISWFLNGKLEKEAVGAKTFDLKTGNPGSVSNVLILIKTPDGQSFQQVINIRPAALDIVWEAQSYTPPFYRGKAMYPYQGKVKFVALPNIVDEKGAVLNPKNLVYTWKIDGSVVGSVSGYGRNFMYLNGSVPINPSTVSVEATSLDKNYTAGGSVTVAPQSPFILFYEDSPIFGIRYNKTLGSNLSLENQEIKIAAIPYFNGVQTREGQGLIYEWRLNNSIVTSGPGNSSLSFKQGSGQSGTSQISLQVTNPAKIFQFAVNSMSIAFGQKPSVNFFSAQ